MCQLLDWVYVVRVSRVEPAGTDSIGLRLNRASLNVEVLIHAASLPPTSLTLPEDSESPRLLVADRWVIFGYDGSPDFRMRIWDMQKLDPTAELAAPDYLSSLWAGLCSPLYFPMHAENVPGGFLRELPRAD